jgi:hypothetical protein
VQKDPSKFYKFLIVSVHLQISRADGGGEMFKTESDIQFFSPVSRDVEGEDED